jgi:hypothetical protein
MNTTYLPYHSLPLACFGIDRDTSKQDSQTILYFISRTRVGESETSQEFPSRVVLAATALDESLGFPSEDGEMIGPQLSGKSQRRVP